jgi:hypothetical protein
LTVLFDSAGLGLCAIFLGVDSAAAEGLTVLEAGPFDASVELDRDTVGGMGVSPELPFAIAGAAETGSLSSSGFAVVFDGVLKLALSCVPLGDSILAVLRELSSKSFSRSAAYIGRCCSFHSCEAFSNSQAVRSSASSRPTQLGSGGAVFHGRVRIGEWQRQ